MPGVFVRPGYLESKRVASLFGNFAAEVFYFHLLLVVGEDGTFEADPVLLKNRCFPAVEVISTADVVRWLEIVEKAGLVRVYDDPATGKKMLEVLRHQPPVEPPKKSPWRSVASASSPKDSDSVLPFEEFWKMYGKKVGRAMCIQKYSVIAEEDRAIIKEKLPMYVAATPDPQYRKNPQTWLNGKCWLDEDVPPSRGGAVAPQTKPKWSAKEEGLNDVDSLF